MTAGIVLLVAWSYASPAYAAGVPICDPRGASAFAPPAQLQAPETFLDELETSCLDEGSDPAADHTPRRPAEGGANYDSALPPVEVSSVDKRSFDCPVLALGGAEEGPRGVRFRIERPPRDPRG